jgi:hypothetical protein
MSKRTSLFRRIMEGLRHPPAASPAYEAVQPNRPPVKGNRQVLVVVEGGNDIEFLRRASAILKADDEALPDLSQLERRGRIVFVPFGGDPRNWVFRFAELGHPEYHLFDREISPATEIRRESARIVNLRPGCHAAITSKRSLENYLHCDAISEARGVEVRFSDDDDVAELVAERCFQRQHPGDGWSELSARARRRLRNRAKSWLNTLAVDRMTVARFAERDPIGEIDSWLRIIAEMAGAPS